MRLHHHRRKSTPTLASAIVFLFISPAFPAELLYPPARRDSVVDVFHGTPVSDPYRWLEQDTAPEVKSWVTAQSDLTRSWLAEEPSRDKIKARLTELWNYPKQSAPSREGEWYFFSRNDGLQRQSVLYRSHGLDGVPEVVIDPNMFSADGTVSLSGTAVSHDARYMTYGLSRSGSDWTILYVRDLSAGRDLADTIQFVRWGGATWHPNGSGFFYTRYPHPDSVEAEDRSNYARVFWHTLNTPQSRDTLVYERSEDKEIGAYVSLSQDRIWLLMYLGRGTDDQNRLYYRSLASAGDFLPLFDRNDAEYSFVCAVADTFYILSNKDAPKRRVVAVDLSHPEETSWREVIPESGDVLTDVSYVNDQLVTSYLRDAHSVVVRYDRSGARLGELPLPGVGSVGGITANHDDTVAFVTFASFVYPSTILRYNFAADSLSVYRTPKIDFDPSAYVTEQVFYPSKDGTRIPMFITHKRGLLKNGENPVWLWGYGGFNISYTPSFLIARLVWLEQGGIYCVANLRGGGEYGAKWHEAGMLEAKQNVFDDYVAAAEWLIANKYTRKDKLLAYGRSNGGLLTAACLVQRPDLYGAVISQVPVIDMLRYHHFTVGRYWTGEYGNAEKDPAHFAFLRKYSPLHNVTPDVSYPPTLILTGDTDDRVFPAHSFKFTAELQRGQSGNAPILLRVDKNAGHGGGKPVDKAIDEETDMNAFAFRALGMVYHDLK